MNYYEELGVTREAKAEEIRLAYRTLARMLHPDRHADEELRAMGERQMRRLNEILEILTDPERRRRYNESLQGARPAKELRAAHSSRGPVGMPRTADRRGAIPMGEGWVQAISRYWFWVLMGAACGCAAMVWWVMAVDRGVAADAAVKKSPFAGVWRSTEQGGGSGDAARTVELELEEAGGVLTGSCRARYGSSEMLLQLQDGKTAGPLLRAGWTTGSGAAGDLEMQLRSAESAAVTWWTTEGGRRALRASGSAVVARQLVTR